MRPAFFLILALLIGCVRPVRDVLGPPVTKGDVEGTWVGYDNSTQYLYGLVLTNIPGSRIVYLYEGHTFEQYSIETWDVHDGRIHILLGRGAGSNAPMSVSAECLGVRGIRMCVRSRSEGWEQTATLVRMETLAKETELLRTILKDGKVLDTHDRR